jgi:hypothetical protein
MTDNDPVHYLEDRFTEEEIIYGRNKCARDYDDNPKQVHSMPELFYLMRVGLHQVVESARE